MRLRTLGAAGAAGLATFLLVFVIVSEALLPYIEFSVLVGVPAGLVAGALIATVVLVQSSQDDGRTRRPLALALGTFGVTFLVGFVVALGGLQAGVAISIAGAAVLGILSGLVAAVRARREPP
ncbi:hypothetical protein ACFR99_09175 [Haloarchaeobius amylolyticus]|uniref:DUF8147 domain-containing protein n=1 Tax=Haloarchaeobius amylolyticus TaxID=1198296 RepID=A0ABD6BFA4_9EURY